MFHLPTPRLTSAHALAFVALVVALGGGYAVAQEGTAPKQTIAYHEAWMKDFKPEPARSSLIGQMVVPAQGQLAVSAKLNVRKARGKEYSPGKVTCFLGAVGTQDNAAVTLDPGEAATLSFNTVGSPAASSVDTQAIDVFCETKKSAYIVSAVRVTAISLDDVQSVEP